MKSIIIKFILITIIVFCSNPIYAQSVKTITLKDGSVLKGKVLKLNDNVYTIGTSNLGLVKINESNILSISTKSGSSQQNINPFNLNANSQSVNPQLMMQAQQLQKTMFADKDFMQDVQRLLKNEDIMSILSDQNFMKDIMSYDQDKIKNNTKVQKLLENPEMKSLIDKVNNKLSVPSP